MRLGRRIWKLDRWLIDELGQEVRRQRVLLAAHRAEFLAEYRQQLPAPDGAASAWAANACLAGFEREALLADESRRDAATT